MGLPALATSRDPVDGPLVPDSSARWNSELLLSALALTLVIASAPIRNAQYVLPWVVAIHFAVAGREWLLVRLLGLTAAVAAVSVVVALLALDPVNASGIFWGSVTYGTLLFWLAWPRRDFHSVDSALIRSRGCDMVAVFIVVQSIVGLAQYVMSRQPDRPDSVTGTLDPLWFRHGGSTISQPSLAVMLVGAILFVAAMRQRRFHTLAVGLGGLCLFVSQAGHQLIILMTAIVLVTLVVGRRPGTLARLFVALVAVVAAAQLLTPDTIRRAPTWFDRAIVSQDSLKRQAWSDALDVIWVETVPGFGSGTGQYSSRAGLISSDEYLSVGLPHVLTGKSELYVERVEPKLEIFERVGEGSAISKPYSSATSLLVEFGPLAALALALAALLTVLGCTARVRASSNVARRTWFALGVGLAFVIGLSFVENYVELAQATFLPGLLYLVAKPTAVALDSAGAGGPSVDVTCQP